MKKNSKILAICESIDLAIPGGMTPFYWQMFKSLCELGTEVIVVPIKGSGVRSLWWRSYSNPTPNSHVYRFVQSVYNAISNPLGIELIRYTHERNKSNSSVLSIHGLLKNFGRTFKTWYMSRTVRWDKLIDDVWKSEGGIDCVVLFSCPLDYMKGVPQFVHKQLGIPVVVYDADLPTYLWSESNFRSSHFYGVELSDYDAFVVNSKGVVKRLRELGAPHVYTLHFGADPNLFSPIQVEQDIDVSFYGYSEHLREEAMKRMITSPSIELKDFVFRTAGKFRTNTGLSKNVGGLNFTAMKRFCCRSKINLNITRKTFAETYSSSTARPFELAAMKCCIVSNPIKGMEEWFTPGKEFFVANSSEETIELYKWLIPLEDVRYRIGENARRKILQEHTYMKRAKEFMDILEGVT